mmetsp:Transcript_10707/g.13332  ORF Transcript_10707/g.13332 Transcript_10707/m.13332 type:complete len:360 (+) Transcript_10707:3-1082(+)
MFWTAFSCATSLEDVPIDGSLAEDDDCTNTDKCALNVLQLKRCPFNFQHDVKDTMVNMSTEIDALNDKLVVLIARALRTSYKDDFSTLVGATSKAASVLEDIAPRFITLTNKTSASLHDAGIDAFGGKAEEEQTSLLRMQRFLVDHAGEVLTNIAAARNSEGDTGFATTVNTAAQQAGQWIQGVLTVAWSTATDQLPRINALVKNEIRNTSDMVTQAACAADTATSISSLTTLYAEIVQAATDCDVSNQTLFSITDCESSALTVQTGISLVIREGARMMHTCYGRDWSCAESMASGTHNLLQAYNSLVVLGDSCKSSDPIALAVCESEAFQLSSSLGVAAWDMHRSSEICASSCNLAKP